MPVRVPMVETLAGPARVTGRHVKQSGGHGQYAVVVVEGEPGPPGSGVVFEQRIVGGTVPSQFHGSVEKGVRAQAERGIGGDRPLVDVHVTLVDGKSHSVDSSDAAFQAAGALALRELAAAAGTRVLEPWCVIEVVVPGDYVGAVMSDLSGPPRARHRQRGRPRPRPHHRPGRDPRGRAADLSGGAALGHPRHRQLLPAAARLRAGTRVRGGRGVSRLSCGRRTGGPTSPGVTCGVPAPGRRVPVRRLPARRRGPLASGTVCSGVSGGVEEQ